MVVVMYDSIYSVKYEGLESDEQLENYVKFAMYNIIDYCPYDSFVKVRILALSQRFLVELNVKSSQERFCGLGEEDTVEDALDAAEQSLYVQVKQWRKTRFNESSTSNKKLSVLVVDDDPLSTKLMETCLIQQGCDVFTATSGGEAIFSLKSRKFNFLIMDWNMRPLNGRQTLKIMDSNININKSASRAKIPVITYTSNNQDQISFPRTENLYQFAYLSKSSTYKKTLETTRTLIGHYNNSMN